MFGALCFRSPFAIVHVALGLVFLCAPLVTPNPSAFRRPELLLRKARPVESGMVETIAFRRTGSMATSGSRFLLLRLLRNGDFAGISVFIVAFV